MVELIRAPLFVPATRPDRFAKAAASGTDAVILDLEDAVAPDQKAAARAALDTGFTELPVLVRINAGGTEWHAEDLAAIRALRPAAVILPKAENAAEIASLAAGLDGVPLIALVETARGLANARAIADLPGVRRLAFGSIDFCADLGCAHERDILLPVRLELVLASRLGGIAAPMDGVTVRLDTPGATRDDVRHARALGMSGKLCIHPRQIAEVQEGFAPSTEELAWALRVLASGDGAVSVNGQMVDEPVRIRARSILGDGEIA